ncbi:bifunctional transcriptional activator/DNA repair enzyme AdaA [Planococcus sp. CAU13]|uniref:bifunctional transcriptional activator/DNA repair enzyme AdaA n=1 Tax=Planococcus sp. CAU13 TaxID=1541197 RepID=UPI00068994E2|nr:Ada metal-binding domain-containing protein [Planococcus sp. CAU13]
MSGFTFEEMWEKIMACDRKYDGLFYTAVKTTKIYCRPSCRSRKPKKVNVEFYATIEEAESRGFRACKRCQPETELSPNAEVVQNVISFLIANHKQKLSLEEVAAHAGLSPSYLDRVFKEETSETPRVFLEKIRVDKAAHLLEHTEFTNLEICYEAGFQSTSHFYKAFRRAKNLSPNEFRKMTKGLQHGYENEQPHYAGSGTG